MEIFPDLKADRFVEFNFLANFITWDFFHLILIFYNKFSLKKFMNCGI